MIVEPELEQVIHKTSSETFTLFNLLDKAKQKDPSTYIDSFNDIEYVLTVDKNIIKRLRYKDVLGNLVEIVFSKQYPDKELTASTFHAKFPADFDIISE